MSIKLNPFRSAYRSEVNSHAPRQLIARILLFLDNRSGFINTQHVKEIQGNICKYDPRYGHFEYFNPREFYALFLFWHGIDPYPNYVSLSPGELSKFPNHKRVIYRFSKWVLLFFRFVRGSSLIQKGDVTTPIDISELFVEYGLPDLLDSAGDVVIVIPVYNAFDYVEICLNSVLATTRTQIIVINDNSTDPRVRTFLDDLCANNDNIRVHHNEKNLGFVESSNLGFKLAGDSDVLLLNSDTVVFGDWFSRICSARNSTQRVGTVTPLSNAATIFSMPFDEEIECTIEFSEKMDSLLSSVLNDQKTIEIPTCHGFCVLITRDVLNLVGDFDQVNFPRGYGEENDLSQRIEKAGYKNLLTTNVLVHHFGNKSFGEERGKLSKAGMEKLLKKHPAYMDSVQDWMQAGPLVRIRLSLLAQLVLTDGHRPLHISHNLGGGVQKSIDIEELSSGAVWVQLAPGQQDTDVKIIFRGFGRQVAANFDFSSPLDFFSKMFEGFRFNKVVLQHTLGFSDFFIDALIDSKIEYTYRIHDYLAVCPKIHLVGVNNSDCGLPDDRDCNNCLGLERHIDILSWRLHGLKILINAKEVSAPSDDTILRYGKVFPFLQIQKKSFDVPHDCIQVQKNKNVGLSIGIIGHIAGHKGYRQLLEVAEECANTNVTFFIFGNIEPGLYLPQQNIIRAGSFQSDEDLNELVAACSPDAFFFPGKIPETYSYALTDALRFHKPILYFEVGAISERMLDHPLGVPLKMSASAADIAFTISKLGDGK